MDNNELYHFGIKGMKWGVRKKHYSDKEISEYRKRKISEAPTKRESPNGANKGWYKNAPKSTLVREMKREEAAKAKSERKKERVERKVDKILNSASKSYFFARSEKRHNKKLYEAYTRGAERRIAKAKKMLESVNSTRTDLLYPMATKGYEWWKENGYYTE